jgi:hypothetical protein
MAANKTRPTGVNVAAFVDALTEPARRRAAEALIKLMKNATGEKLKMWGPSIIGSARGFLTAQTRDSSVWGNWGQRRRDAAREPGETHYRQRLPLHKKSLRRGPKSVGEIDC